MSFKFSIFFSKEETGFLTIFLKRFSLYLKSSFGRPMETGGSCGIRRLMYPLVPSVSHKGWRRRATEKMRGHYIVPWLVHWMRAVTPHTEVMDSKPRTISVQMQPRTVQVAPLTCAVIAMLLILISDA